MSSDRVYHRLSMYRLEATSLVTSVEDLEPDVRGAE